MYTLVLLKSATEELEREGVYSENKWGKKHAGKYIKELSKRIRSLTKNPHLYRTHDDLLPGLRLMTFKLNFNKAVKAFQASCFQPVCFQR